MKVILCAYNWIGCKALDLLQSQNHEIFVFTHDNPAHINSLKELCQRRNIKYSTERISKDNIPFVPDIICSIYYRYIIKEDLISLVEGKIFNLHPSLLPDYRGCSSLTWAMINGEQEVGFTYHYIDVGIDTGNILYQESMKIEDWDTQITLYHRVMFNASKKLLKVFEDVSEGIKGTLQVTGGKYYKRGCPLDGEINETWNIEKKERFIRAMNYPPLPYATLNGTEIRRLSDLNKDN